MTDNAELFERSSSVIMGAQLQIALGESTALSYEVQRTYDSSGEAVDKMTIGTQTSF
ncbi:MAG: hypothetical protein WD492_09570 [Alkalispirochaeta sp.]